MPWSPPSLTVVWPSYFRPDPEDQGKLVELTAKARGAGLITTRSALEKLQSVFAVESVDAALAALENEAAERRRDSAEANHVLARAMSRDDESDESDEGDDEGGDDARGTPPAGA